MSVAAKISVTAVQWNHLEKVRTLHPNNNTHRQQTVVQKTVQMLEMQFSLSPFVHPLSSYYYQTATMRLLCNTISQVLRHLMHDDGIMLLSCWVTAATKRIAASRLRRYAHRSLATMGFWRRNLFQPDDFAFIFEGETFVGVEGNCYIFFAYTAWPSLTSNSMSTGLIWSVTRHVDIKIDVNGTHLKRDSPLTSNSPQWLAGALI